jgi:hypothetical protein
MKVCRCMTVFNNENGLLKFLMFLKVWYYQASVLPVWPSLFKCVAAEKSLRTAAVHVSPSAGDVLPGMQLNRVCEFWALGSSVAVNSVIVEYDATFVCSQILTLKVTLHFLETSRSVYAVSWPRGREVKAIVPKLVQKYCLLWKAEVHCPVHKGLSPVTLMTIRIQSACLHLIWPLCNYSPIYA